MMGQGGLNIYFQYTSLNRHLRSLDLVWNVDISIDRSTELMRQLIFLQFSWTVLIQIIFPKELCLISQHLVPTADLRKSGSITLQLFSVYSNNL